MLLISDVKGVGPATAKALAEKGFKSAEQLARAGAPDIVVVSGIGDARANTLIAAAKALLAAADVAETPASKKPASTKLDRGGKKKKSAKSAAKAKKKGKKKGKKKAKGADKGSKKKKSKKKKSKGKKK